MVIGMQGIRGNSEAAGGEGDNGVPASKHGLMDGGDTYNTWGRGSYLHFLQRGSMAILTP